MTSPAPLGTHLGNLRHNRLQRNWDRRAPTWDHGGATGLERVVKAVLDTANGRPGAKAVDLGCGTGSLALALAHQGVEVTAVDISPEMVAQLREKAALEGLSGVSCLVCPIEQFDLPQGSVDLVVSNYALHHLRDQDKEELVRRALGWLRPGGRLVVGDMMFGRGKSPRDWAIIATKVRVLARRGPAGWWRVAKNIVRFGLRVQERPVDMQAWESYFRRAGFSDVVVRPVVAEACVVSGTKAVG